VERTVVVGRYTIEYLICGCRYERRWTRVV